MATPRADTYNAASGAAVHGGRSQTGRDAMLQVLRSMAAGSWQQVSLNTFQSAWAPADYRPSTGLSPLAHISAWSGFGWDDAGCRLVLFGGGHGNSWDNAVYIWNGATRQWQVGFHSTDMAANGVDTIDGALKSPVSSHTYGSNNYLPNANKFMTMGGAAQPSGSGLKVFDAAGTVLREAHLYTLDLANAGKGWVAGDAGTNYKRGTTAGINLPGANAWALRDWALLGVTNQNLAVSKIDNWTQVESIAGKDVIFASLWSSGTTKGLLKITLDAANPALDTIEVLGKPWDNASTDYGGAVSLTHQVAIAPQRSTTIPIGGWDLLAAGVNNPGRNIPMTAFTGSGVAAWTDAINRTYACGCLFDEVRGKFVLWYWGGEVFYITPPADHATLLTSGWTVEVAGSNAMAPRPDLPSEFASERESGVHGKWRRSKTLDCYIGLTHVLQGQVWIYKPTGWTEPAP